MKKVNRQLPSQLSDLKFQLTIDTSETLSTQDSIPSHAHDAFSPSLISHAIHLHSNRIQAEASNKINSKPLNIFNFSHSECNDQWDSDHSPRTSSNGSSFSFSNDEDDECGDNLNNDVNNVDCSAHTDDNNRNIDDKLKS